MQSSAVFSILLPMALVVIMLGLGLSLTVADFRKVISRPKPVVVALICQTLILPVICFGIVYASALPAAVAVLWRSATSRVSRERNHHDRGRVRHP